MLLQAADYVGVFVFAVSGALVAREKQMDIFGYVVLALMPAIAGGTIRDLVLDVPVFWISDSWPLYLAGSAALLTFVAERLVSKSGVLLKWLDALGLSVFCVIGAAKTLAVTGSPSAAVVLGVVTAVAGGIIRDVIANNVPLILQREIYATAAVFGALSYLVLEHYGVAFSQWWAIGVALLVRTIGLTTQLNLPGARR